MSTEKEINVTFQNVDFVVVYEMTAGEKAIIHLAPEDCRPAEPDSIDIIEIQVESLGNVLPMFENPNEFFSYIEDICVQDHYDNLDSNDGG